MRSKLRPTIWIKLTAILSITTALLILEGCETVTLKDEILYGNKGMLGAVEFHTLTSGQVNLTFEQWMQILKNKPLVCTSIDTVADVKAAMEKICSICNCCAYDQTKAAETLFSNIMNLEGKK